MNFERFSDATKTLGHHDSPETDEDGTDSPMEADDDGIPGFGILGTLAGLGTTSYLLNRRLDERDTEEY